MDAVELHLFEVAAAEGRALELGAAQVALFEVAAFGARARQVGAFEPRLFEVGAACRRVDEERARQVALLDVDAVERRPAEVGVAQVGLLEVGVAQPRPRQVGAAEARRLEVRAGEIDRGQLGAAEIGAAVDRPLHGVGEIVGLAAPQDVAVAMLDFEVHGYRLAIGARRRQRRCRQTALPIAPDAPAPDSAGMLPFVERARRPQEAPTPSPLPPALLRWLGAQGVEVAIVAARFGLPGDAAGRDEVDVTPTAADELIEEAAALVGDPFLALRLPAELPFRRYGLHELAARASGTVREAMVRVTRYASLIHPRMSFALDEEGGEARWRQQMRGYPRGVGKASNEYAVGSALLHLRRAAGEGATVRRVWFMHPRPRDLGPLHRFFGTRELDFGCDDNGLAFDAALLERAAPEADARLLATVEPLAEAALRAQPPARDFADDVAGKVRALLPDGANVDAVAGALHMSARTLQRRLGEAGTQFSEVLDGVRASEAKRALAGSDVPIAEIAWRLGFADLATFSRAFKRWTGQPPGTYRRTAAPNVR